MSVAYHSRVMIHGLWLIAIPNGKGKAVKLWQGKKGEEKNVLKFFICLALCIPLWSVSRAAVPSAFPLPVGTDVSNRFVGTVYRNDLIQTDSVYQLPQTNVISFEAGSHSGWHTHGAMTIIGIAGTGLYQEWEKEPVLICPGDVVQIPAGVSHFHGATKNSSFQQFVIYDSQWKASEGVSAHVGALTEEEYQRMPMAEDKENREDAGTHDFLFGAVLQELVSPNFNQPVYLGKILTTLNVADSSEWNYVAFPEGAYNRWHSHKTGQVLIATDGIGLHQLQGGAVEILHPGDVAFCPPGMLHWHGAATDSPFVHIAINPKDNHEVTWYAFPETEYNSMKK